MGSAVGLIPVGDSVVFFVPRSRHVEYFIFHNVIKLTHYKKARELPGVGNFSGLFKARDEETVCVTIDG